MSALVRADKSVRGTCDGSRKRLHPSTDVTRPLSGRRSSHHLHDNTQRPQHVDHSRCRMVHHSRRQRTDALRVSGTACYY